MLHHHGIYTWQISGRVYAGRICFFHRGDTVHRRCDLAGTGIFSFQETGSFLWGSEAGKYNDDRSETPLSGRFWKCGFFI